MWAVHTFLQSIMPAPDSLRSVCTALGSTCAVWRLSAQTSSLKLKFKCLDDDEARSRQLLHDITPPQRLRCRGVHLHSTASCHNQLKTEN